MLLENFGSYFVNVLLSVINGFIGLFLSPIVSSLNSLLSAFIYGYDEQILMFLHNINIVVSNVIVPNVVWVINLFPPFTFQVVLLLLGLWLFIWTYEFTAGIVIRVVKLIKDVVPLA